MHLSSKKMYSVPPLLTNFTGQLSFFSDRPKNHTIGRGDLVFCQVLLNSIQWFQRISQTCLSQPEARQAIFFSNRSGKKHKLRRGYLNLASCRVSSNSDHQFQRISRICENVTTTDRQQTTHWYTIVHNSAT